jgi:hypothetical protein
MEELQPARRAEMNSLVRYSGLCRRRHAAPPVDGPIVNEASSIPAREETCRWAAASAA